MPLLAKEHKRREKKAAKTDASDEEFLFKETSEEA